jgi:hypothetical protein
MNPRILEDLARQHQVDMRRRVDGRDCRSPARAVTGPARRRRSGSARVSAYPRVNGSARVSARHDRHTRDASRSLRARTGWWLVDLGLKIAVRPDAHRAASPRPAGS